MKRKSTDSGFTFCCEDNLTLYEIKDDKGKIHTEIEVCQMMRTFCGVNLFRPDAHKCKLKPNEQIALELLTC